MICRFCGRELKSQAGILISSYSRRCTSSSDKKHLLVSDGEHCIYCGRSVRATALGLRSDYGVSCSQSPSGKHQLQ